MTVSSILPICISNDFLDGSDIYAIFCTAKQTFQYIPNVYIKQIIHKIFYMINIQPIPTEYDIINFFNLIYLPIIVEKLDLKVDHTFLVSWFYMRLVLLSSYILHNRKICYYCKNSSNEKPIILNNP